LTTREQQASPQIDEEIRPLNDREYRLRGPEEQPSPADSIQGATVSIDLPTRQDGPVFKTGDDPVLEIKEYLQRAETDPSLQMAIFPHVDDWAETCKILRRFLPRNPKEEFWLSDCIINAVLKGMFFDHNDVQVII